MWNHFGYEVDESGKRIDDKHVRCRVPGCGKSIAYSGNTTNLRQHLQIWHPQLLEDTRVSCAGPSRQVKLEEFTEHPKSKLAPGGKRSREITRMLAEFVARDLRPVALTEGKGFLQFVRTLEPGYQMPSRKTLMKELHVMQGEVQASVASGLEKSKFVSLTTDFWTSLANDSYLGVTVHLVTSDWELKSCVLQTREVKERHTAVNVAGELRSVAGEWKIADKIVATTTDNAPNMVNAVASVLEWTHIGCLAHTLQIAVRAGLALPSVAELLAHCRRLVGHFNRSSLAQTALEVKQEEYNLPKKKLKQDVVTRWNSTFDMLSSVVEQQQAISSVLAGSSKPSDRDMIPSSADLRKFGYVLKVLEPLAQATTLLCSEKVLTLSIVQPVLTALLRRHLETSDDDPRLILDLKTTIASNLKAHISDPDRRNLRLLASVLDPRHKDLRFLPSSERAKVYSDLLSAATALSQASQVESVVHDVQPPPKRHRKEELLYFSDSSDSNGSSPFTELASMAEKEVNLYRAEESIDSKEDPLAWWRANEHRFRTLSVLAKKFFCMSATSVPVERLFSKAGTIVSKKRASLHPKNVDCLIFLNNNL